MLSFGVCDDQSVICRDIGARIKIFMESAKLDCVIYTFSNGDELIRAGQKIDILFLDIKMPVMDGFQVAEKMNQKNDELIIVFLTGHTERFQRAFKVNAFRYLIKPVGLQDFNEALSDALARIFSQRKLVVDTGNREVFISDDKILFVESIGDRTVMHTQNEGKLVSGKTLKHWESVLDPLRFIRTHKSFIVSFEYIRSVNRASILMADGADIPVSTRSTQSVKAGLGGYVRRMARGGTGA